MKNEIIINLSRVDKNGSGLYVFSKHTVKFLSSRFKHLSVVTQASIDIDVLHPRYKVPAWVTVTPWLSVIRPISWFIYSFLFFPGKKGRILSTTHHVVPGAPHQIITIHDTRPFLLPDSIFQEIYFKYILANHVHKVSGVITVSETTKQSIVQRYNVFPEKIHVVYNCLDVSLFKPKRTELIVENQYLLMVGSTWKHKNAHELIEMHNLWSSEYHLKIVAGKGKYKASLEDLVGRLNIKDKVEFIGYLPEEELIELYQNAAVMVYPSLIEGFGIPPLEAMACGVPVIVSDIPIFREVYGDVPIYVELGNLVSWQRSFDILKNKQIISMKINDGFKKANEYSEDRMRSSLMKAIDVIWPELNDKF